MQERCITRSTNPAATTALMRGGDLKGDKYTDFQWRMMGSTPSDYARGFTIHLCGHYVVGGPGAGADPYVGPLEPLWWLHHVNLDR